MTEKFTQWAQVEIMGRQRVVGRCSEEVIAGTALLRVDIPKDEGFTTEYVGGGAIYRMTVVTEEVARKLCSQMSMEPAFAWSLKQPPVELLSHKDEEELDDLSDDPPY